LQSEAESRESVCDVLNHLSAWGDLYLEEPRANEEPSGGFGGRGNVFLRAAGERGRGAGKGYGRNRKAPDESGGHPSCQWLSGFLPVAVLFCWSGFDGRLLLGLCLFPCGKPFLDVRRDGFDVDIVLLRGLSQDAVAVLPGGHAEKNGYLHDKARQGAFGIVGRLARDLHAEFPGPEGFSPHPAIYAKFRGGVAGRGDVATGRCKISLGPSDH